MNLTGFLFDFHIHLIDEEICKSKNDKWCPPVVSLKLTQISGWEWKRVKVTGFNSPHFNTSVISHQAFNYFSLNKDEKISSLSPWHRTQNTEHISKNEVSFNSNSCPFVTCCIHSFQSFLTCSSWPYLGIINWNIREGGGKQRECQSS